MGRKTAIDIMVPLHDYPHASDSQTLRDGVLLLETSEIRFDGRTSMPRILLIFDDNDHLLGSARRRDILRGLEPDYHSVFDTTHPEAHIKAEIDPNLSDLIDDDRTDRLRHRLDRPLREVVREFDSTVDIDDSLMKIVRELVSKDTHLAVVKRNGDVVGVVRTLDLLRAICNDL